MSELESVRIHFFAHFEQNWKVSELESVRIRVSELESVRTCFDWKVSELESVRNG